MHFSCAYLRSCVCVFSSNLNCGWKIEASWGYVVRLYVARVDLEESSDCGFDSISVFDGGKFCYTSQHIIFMLVDWVVVGEEIRMGRWW